MSDDSEELPVSDTFYRQILGAAKRLGRVVVESQICPYCGVPNWHCHNWSETLNCMNPDCGKTFSSKAERLPLPGELRLEHLNHAIETLLDAYVTAIKTKLPMPTREEMDALSPDLKTWTARVVVMASRNTLETAKVVAESFAQQQG